MSDKSILTRTLLGLMCLSPLVGLQAAYAASYDEARDAFNDKNWEIAIELLVKELDAHPGHTAARILLGQSYESVLEWDKAEGVWEDVMKVSQGDEHADMARRGLIRVRRHELERRDIESLRAGASAAPSARDDPFGILLPPIDWSEIETVESTDYLSTADLVAAGLPPYSSVNGIPPFHYATEHFDSFATNEKLAALIGDHAEIYLDFMNERLFGGRAWGFRVPIFCYATRDDYQSQGGGSAGSGGHTMPDALLGRSVHVAIFHRTEIENEDGRKEDVMYKYAINSILFHELTHVMIIEFFGGQEVPQWLHEAVAGRMELTRDHYLEAARLARAVVAGEHFRFRDLFEQEGYPSSRIGLFYEQSAIIVLYLFEAGPEAMYTLFRELAQQHTHDQALAAALGIPEEGAVEEFERMWVEWMKRRYVMDLKPDPGEKIEIELAEAVTSSALQPAMNEIGAIEAITEWRSIPTQSLADDFCGVGETLEDWSAAGSNLRGNPPDDGFGGAYLGIKMFEKLPLAIRCTVRSQADGWAGFALLDSARNETGIEVLAPVKEGREHELVALLGDELAIFLDGECTGRYPRPLQDRLDAAIDFPLALVTYGPLEISKIEVAYVKDFDIAEPEEEEEDNKNRRSRGRSGGSRGRGGSRGNRPR